MTKSFLDDESPFTSELLRSTAQAANLPDLQTARERIAAYAPRDAGEALLAAQAVANQAAMIIQAGRAMQPGLSVEELLYRTDLMIKLDREVRAVQRLLGNPKVVTSPSAQLVPLDLRLKAHFVDGSSTVH